jgi:peroxiredoxin
MDERWRQEQRRADRIASRPKQGRAQWPCLVGWRRWAAACVAVVFVACGARPDVPVEREDPDREAEEIEEVAVDFWDAPWAPVPVPDERLGTLFGGTGHAAGVRIVRPEEASAGRSEWGIRSLVARAPLVVVFYQGGWHPSCVAQLEALSGATEDGRLDGVLVVGVSVDSIERTALFVEETGIGLPLIADPGRVMVERFGVAEDVSEDRQLRLERAGVSLAAWSGTGEGTVARSAAFVVNVDGDVLWSHVEGEDGVRLTAEQLRRVLASIPRDVLWPPVIEDDENTEVGPEARVSD